jgi:hypothetical protein
MALPSKKNKKDLDIKRRDPQGGPKEYVDQFLEQNKANLPRGIEHADLDSGFVDFVEKDLELTFNGDKVPVLFLTLSRWREFTKTWQNSDKYKNIKIPFISIVRNPDAQPGTNPADFKIPVRKPFVYSKIPKWDGNKKGMDLHMVPQPVGVDLTYNVRLFSYKMTELNKMNKKVLQAFASAQAYVNIKGHYFPIMLESIGDESDTASLDKKRYYVQTYTMKLLGYIVDEDEFEVVPAIERAFVSFELDEKRPKAIARFVKDDTTNDLNTRCLVQFQAKSATEVSFPAESRIVFNSIDVKNVSSYIIKVNGTTVSTPFSVEPGDTITVSIIRTDSTLSSEVILNGTIIK